MLMAAVQLGLQSKALKKRIFLILLIGMLGPLLLGYGAYTWQWFGINYFYMLLISVGIMLGLFIFFERLIFKYQWMVFVIVLPASGIIYLLAARHTAINYGLMLLSAMMISSGYFLYRLIKYGHKNKGDYEATD